MFVVCGIECSFKDYGWDLRLRRLKGKGLVMYKVKMRGYEKVVMLYGIRKEIVCIRDVIMGVIVRNLRKWSLLMCKVNWKEKIMCRVWKVMWIM